MKVERRGFLKSILGGGAAASVALVPRNVNEARASEAVSVPVFRRENAGRQQTYNWQGGFWEWSLSFGPIAGEDYPDWQGFIVALEACK